MLHPSPLRQGHVISQPVLWYNTYPEGGDFQNLQKKNELCIAEVKRFAIFQGIIASSRI